VTELGAREQIASLAQRVDDALGALPEDLEA